MDTKLTHLKAGEEGDILEVRGPEQNVHRLEEMGIRRGVRLRMLRTGSPCIIAVGDSNLAYRDRSVEIIISPVLNDHNSG